MSEPSSREANIVLLIKGICRPLTRKEKLVQGLSGQKQSPRLQVVHLGPPKGRGVVTKEKIIAGEFVCEYKTYRVYTVGSELHKELEQEYNKNGEGSFTVQTTYPIPDVGRLCFDATRRYRDVGRLINHSPHPNLSISRPIHLRGKWRLGLMAIREIAPGIELTFDYGIREMEWMRSRQDHMRSWRPVAELATSLIDLARKWLDECSSKDDVVENSCSMRQKMCSSGFVNTNPRPAPKPGSGQMNTS